MHKGALPWGLLVLRQHRADEAFADAAFGLQHQMDLCHQTSSSFLGW
jgi:hypothetical protein